MNLNPYGKIAVMHSFKTTPLDSGVVALVFNGFFRFVHEERKMTVHLERMGFAG
jgi:hypothetical protein